MNFFNDLYGLKKVSVVLKVSLLIKNLVFSNH